MKIAILSDIHGNIDALKAVIKEINHLKIDQLFILGDLVGYYYYPDQVIKELDNFSVEMIKGNHEEILKKGKNNNEYFNEILSQYGHGIDMALKKIDSHTFKRLTELPDKKIILRDNLKIELCHGSPWDRDLYIYPDTNIDVLKRCVDSNTDFILIGHSHHHFIFQYNNSMLINVGSVGQNRLKGGVATWAVINTTNKTIIQKQTMYNTNKLIKEIKKNLSVNPHSLDKI